MSAKFLKIETILFATILTLVTACSTDEKQTVITKKTLVMSEEFDVAGVPNPDLWSYDIGLGPNPSNPWGNFELQYYTDRTQNIIVENGNLKITARREQYMGSSYTSARIISKGKYEKKCNSI